MKKDFKVKKKKLIAFIILDFITLFSFTFVFYGPWSGFRNFWITSSMTTMNHKYLARWFYTDKAINKVLAMNSVVESGEVSDPDLIHFKKYTTSIYKNKYEKEILNHDKDDVYKLIDIKGTGYKGFLVAIYDPSRVHIATSSKLRVRGESILEVSEREEAIVAMNAGGFYDPDWNSNGALPHGTVIKDGVVVSDYVDARMGGGFIGFDEDDKFILGNMSKEEALAMKMRDAIEFGPYLIVNGKRSFVKGNGGWGIAPRSAIGQRKDGIVLFLVINGRLSSSIGVDLVELTDILYKYGAYNASNLDGGSSSELVINNKIINTPVAGGENGLRDMSTFWIVQ